MSNAPVLDYDPLTNAYVARQWRRRIVLLLLFGTVGAFIGFAVRPHTYRGSGFLMLGMRANPDGSNTFLLQDPVPHIAAIQSAPSYIAAVGAARINGVTLTQAEVAKNLKVHAIPESRLIEVSYTSPNPTIAAAVTTMVINNYVASAAPSVTLAANPGPPAGEADKLFIAAGAAAGLGLGWLVVSLRRG